MFLRTKPALAHAASLAIAMIAAALLPPGGPAASALVQYVGRLHLLVLHLPIGVLVVVLVAEAATLTRHREEADVVTSFALPLLVGTGAAAIVFGLCLGHGDTEHPLRLLTKHRNFTIAGILLAAVAGAVFPYRRGRAVHRALLLASAAVLSVGAHFGGSLTHGSNYLFAPIARTAPAVAEDAGAPAADVTEAADAGVADASVVDASVSPDVDAAIPVASAPLVRDAGAPVKSHRVAAQAVLLRRCAPCHTERSKGGLRVTDIGKMKAADVVAGDPGASLLYTQLFLPKDDDDHMPPIDKPQPSAGEIATLKAWISELKTYP